MKNIFMNKWPINFLLFLVYSSVDFAQNKNPDLLNRIPNEFLGNFKDDYDINYSINDSIWVQHPGITYHLIKYDSAGQYFIAKNDDANSGNPGLFTRIDIILFKNMEPWLWGFCLTDYKAKTFEEAEANISAYRNDPKKGCAGFPFSRMMKE